MTTYVLILLLAGQPVKQQTGFTSMLMCGVSGDAWDKAAPRHTHICLATQTPYKDFK